MIRRVDFHTKMMTVFVGAACEGYQYNCERFNGDGHMNVDTSIYSPTALFVDRKNNLYFSDSNNYRVRVVDGTTLRVSTIVGELCLFVCLLTF